MSGNEFIGRCVASRFSRQVVQQQQHLLDLRGSDRLEVGPLREELTRQTVGVLIGPPLLGRIECRNVDRSVEGGRHLLVLDKLGSRIEGQRLHPVCHRRQQSDDRLLHGFRRFLWDRSPEGEQRFALNKGNQGALPNAPDECMASQSPIRFRWATIDGWASIGVLLGIREARAPEPYRLRCRFPPQRK